MKLIKITLTFTLLFSFSLKCISQDDIVKYQIFLKPIQLLFKETSLGLENVINNRLSLTYNISYKFSNNNKKEVTGFCAGICGDYQLQNMVNQHYKALGLSIAPNFYVLFPNFYISPEISYKYWWFNKQQASYDNVEGYSFDALRSEKAKDIGIKLSLGYTFKKTIFNSKKIISVINVYLGLGFKSRRYQYESWGGTIGNSPNVYLIENNQTKFVYPFIGTSLGLGKSKQL